MPFCGGQGVGYNYCRVWVCREYRTSLAWGTFGGFEWYSSNLGLVIVASASLCDLAVTQERLHKTALHLACQVELVVGGG